MEYNILQLGLKETKKIMSFLYECDEQKAHLNLGHLWTLQASASLTIDDILVCSYSY